MKLEGLLLKIEASIVEVTNSHLRKVQKEEGSFSNWDGLMKRNWSKLINPPLVYTKSSKKAREDYKWSPPRMDGINSTSMEQPEATLV